MASRLSYSSEYAPSGETFARADHASGWFGKGFLGAGRIINGKLNDEDFLQNKNAYSDEFIPANKGNLGYGAFDVGYNILQSAGNNVGLFVGYAYYHYHIDTHGCTQIAGAINGCNLPTPPGFVGIAEDDTLHAVRLGVSSQMMVTDRLRLTADAAYIPWFSWSGYDDHNSRQLLLPQSATGNNGAMIEAMLDYYVTDAWTIGVGGRYWSWKTKTGSTTFQFLDGSELHSQPARYNTERYGLFLQSSYRWDADRRLASAQAEARSPRTNWTGFYVGGHLGGGFGDDSWSDPFASSPGHGGQTNVAGFGDHTHAIGAAAGGYAGYNLQLANIVYGIELDASGAALHGEQTCFSGIGGVNCERKVNALGTLTGRLGYSWDQSLLYAKAGGALANTKYTVMGNTDLITLGQGSNTVNTGGFTAGTGFERAINGNWSARFEYDYVNLARQSVSFPTVERVSSAAISVRQSLHLFQVGVSYRL